MIDRRFGPLDSEYRRVAAVHRCKEFLSARGWQVGESDPKCVFDVFAYKRGDIKHEFIRIQVRSSSITSQRGWPVFKTSRLHFNTKECSREQFQPGDFDYWFFYADDACWMIPFEEVINKSEVSMEGYDQYFVG
jgi:hypothetical protein